MSFSDDDAISSGDDFSLYPGTFGRHRPLPEDRLFYDTVDEIRIKIIWLERICTALYGLTINMENSTDSAQILEDMDNHAEDIEKKVTLFLDYMHMIFRNFYSVGILRRAEEARTDALRFKKDVNEFFVIAQARFEELRDASAPFREPPAKRSRVRMTESRNERAVEPKAEAEAEDCAGPGIVPGPLVASGRMGPGLCRAWE